MFNFMISSQVWAVLGAETSVAKWCVQPHGVLGAEATADPAELKALEVAVRGAALERSMERSRLMATAAEARLARTQQRTATGMKAKVGS